MDVESARVQPGRRRKRGAESAPPKRIQPPTTSEPQDALLSIDPSVNHPVVDVPQNDVEAREVLKFIADETAWLSNYLKENFDGADEEVVTAVVQEVAECVVLLRSATEHAWWDASSIERVVSAWERREAKKVVTKPTETPVVPKETKTEPVVTNPPPNKPGPKPAVLTDGERAELLKKPADKRFFAVVKYLAQNKKMSLDPDDLIIVGNHLVKVHRGLEKVRGLGITAPKHHYPERQLRHFYRKAKAVFESL